MIIGYRADDSYFSFANAFLNNTLSLEQLKEAMYLGKLGEQVITMFLCSMSQLGQIMPMANGLDINKIISLKTTLPCDQTL